MEWNCARRIFTVILFTADGVKERGEMSGEPFDKLRVISGSALLDSLALIIASPSQR
jgi:hypothetical protein